MLRSALISSIRPEFDDFLYASIGEERNGMLLSVLSALARQGVDPWEEAASLTRLPPETAISKLASMIAALPDGSAATTNPQAQATRLVGLLPRYIRAPRVERPQAPAVESAEHSTVINYILFFAIFIVFMLCSEWLMTRGEVSATAGAPAAVTNTRHLDATSNAD